MPLSKYNSATSACRKQEPAHGEEREIKGTDYDKPQTYAPSVVIIMDDLSVGLQDTVGLCPAKVQRRIGVRCHEM